MDEEKVIEAVEQTEPVQETKPEVTQPVETPAQLSFRQLREKAERLERERDEYYKQLNSRREQPERQAVEESDEELHIDANDLVEGKHLKSYEKKLKKLEKQLSDSQKRSLDSIAETRIRSELPDFDKVVTQDALYILQSQFPELAASINANPDLYSKAKAAHQAITKLNINPNDYSSQQEIINKNLAKPKNSQSVSPQQSDSPLTQANAFANGLTDDIKKQLYAEMRRYSGM